MRRSDNGLTVYDADGVPRVNIRPEEIGAVEDYSNGSFAVASDISTEKPTPKKYNDLGWNKKAIGRYAKNDHINFKNLVLNLYAYNSNNMLMGPLSTVIKTSVKLYNSAGKIINTFVFDCYPDPSKVIYIFTSPLGCTAFVSQENDVKEYNIPADDNYFIQFEVNAKSGEETFMTIGVEGYKPYGSASVQYNKFVDNQTFIGTDGFFSTPKENAFVWCGKDGIRLQSDNLPNKMLSIDDNGVRICGQMINVYDESIAGYKRTPVFFHPYNYCPICMVGENGHEIGLNYVQNLGS